MANNEIKKYIENAYRRLLDYAEYWCSQEGLEGESTDVLHEVIYSLLQKQTSKLTRMLVAKKGEYCELDWYILRMVKLNATSPTSPYRHKYKSLPVDANTDYSAIEIEDISDEDDDRPGEILSRMRRLREIVDELCLSDYAKSVFMWRMSGESWADWTGIENEKELFETFYKVRDMVKERLNNKSLF